tara:strand:- start:1715 stop:1873 length:159 start_codon:yes stop_codon:yes gene_type:complete
MKKKIPKEIILFLIILGVVMIVLGFILNDFKFFIRAIIFAVAVLVATWMNKR